MSYNPLLESSGRTLPLKVAQTGFLIDRLGMDCAPLQFVRELTKNSIEAIQRTDDKTGEIVWDVDWVTFDLDGKYKLSITDQGDGMTGEEMERYINQLSSTSGIQSHIDNFGLGAKIAAATRNHAGLIYLSWKNGQGSMIHLWRDPDSGEYGLHQMARPDGSFGHWAFIDDDVKPELIEGHGTKVILYGNTEDANTMNSPEGAASPSRWITRYLNTRFYEFPDGIKVRAREGWENDRTDTDRNVLRTLTGQRQYLENHKESSGSVKLSSAIAHWWILKNETALSQNSGFIASSGHIAALWDDELYEMTVGRGNTAMLQNFGIVFGYQRVVIYLEPLTADGAQVTTNTSRTHLLMNSQVLPWADWAEEFRNSMPARIVSHMEDVAAASEASDHKSAIKDRLKQVQDLYRLSRYRATADGRLRIDTEHPVAGGQRQDSDQETKKAKTKTGGGKGGKGGSVYSLFLSKTGDPGEEIKPDIFPEVRWISTTDGTRNPGDLEDRAARYLEPQNLLLINSDFRVFTDMVKRWTKHYGDVPGVEATVAEVTREWFEQSLIEAVISSVSLRGSQHWVADDIDKMLSDEGLSAVVLPRWHIEQSIKRTLGAKLGSTKGRAA